VKHLDQARAILAEAVKLPAASLPDDASVQTLAAWDSIAHVHVILALERIAGRELSTEAIAGLNSLADIATLLGEE
jgi:acyl carrier protein